MNVHYCFRDAAVADVAAIHQVIAVYVKKDLLLPRTKENIRRHIADFAVAETAEKQVVGCAAIRDYGNSLYEIRSVAVLPEHMGKQAGRGVVRHIIDKVRKEKSPCRLFALTRKTSFFLKLGFEKVNKSLFPEKIWSDCMKCPKVDCCDEDAVMIELK